MVSTTTLHDLIGIEHCKQGFYQELQQKVELLKTSNVELDKGRKEMHAVLDGITDLMVVLSEDMRILRINHVFREWFSDSDPVGRYCYEVFRGNFSICDDCPAVKSLDRSEIVKELAIYKVHGKFRQFEIIASPLKSEPTGERQVLLFKRDVTLEKEFQAQFYQAEKMATVGTLAAGVAHEINNPLAAISGFAEGLKRRFRKMEDQLDLQMTADLNEYANTIISECDRCRDIVQTLLTFSRPMASSLRPVDVNHCVNDTLFILQHHLKDRQNLSVQTDLLGSLPYIMGDESQLKQVIINLLTNAFDATVDGGSITVQTKLNEAGGVELVVEDTGYGIPPDAIDKLFEPFFTTKPVGQGIGIGLSTCYSIVKNHHGEISVSSVDGEGTSFLVTLPGIKP